MGVGGPIITESSATVWRVKTKIDLKGQHQRRIMTANSSSVSTWFGDDDNNNRNETSLGIDWDDWDLDLWTPEQRQLLELGRIPRHVYIVLGVLLTLIVLFGFTANSTILYVFSRF